MFLLCYFEVLPPGPTSVADLFDWAITGTKKVFPESLPSTSVLHTKTIVLTSEFTGMGTAELSLRFVMDGIKKCLSEGAGVLQKTL